jgi:hypothetical protein
MWIKPKLLILGMVFCLGIVCFEGCHSRPPLEELGELEFAVPDLPGINDPYPFPESAGPSSPQSGSEQSPEHP